MCVEPPRAQSAHGWPPGPTLTQASATARANRTRSLPAASKAAIPVAARDASLAAAASLVLTGRGDLWVVAVAIGVAGGSALTTLTVVLAGVASLARVGSAGLADITGNQGVLGAAGFTGSGVAVAAAWASAGSLVLAGRQRSTGAVLGALGGMLVAGPAVVGGMNSALTWAGGTALGGAAGWLAAASPRRAAWQPWVAVGVGAVAVALSVAAGYR